MKKDISIFLFVLLLSCDNSMAQKQDSAPARSIVEKGAQGDIILGKENKKNQLSATPTTLNAADSPRKKEIHSKKNKGKKSK